MCTYIYIYMCIYICIFAYIYIHVYIHIYIFAYIYMYICIYTCKCVYVCIHLLIRLVVGIYTGPKTGVLRSRSARTSLRLNCVPFSGVAASCFDFRASRTGGLFLSWFRGASLLGSRLKEKSESYSFTSVIGKLNFVGTPKVGNTSEG